MLGNDQIYVQQDGTIPTTCPACGIVRSIPSSQFNHRGGPVQITCPCGTTFTILAEFRKAYRRAVNLRGTYKKGAPSEEQGKIQIKNMSMTGVAFEAEEGHRLCVGDELILYIVMDNSSFEDIQATVEVIHISENLAGCRFKGLDTYQDDTLASYLMRIR